MRWLALALAALALSGCETTAQKSAKLERLALQRERAAPGVAAGGRSGVSIVHPSTRLKLSSATVLHSSEGAAVVLALRNTSSTAQRDVPVRITVRDAHGTSVYTNDAPGLAPGLDAAPLLAGHATTTWVDDQIQAAATPASVSVELGEGSALSAAPPRLSVTGAHLIEDATSGPGAEGAILNRSRVAQRELIVYAVARRAGRILAAGRAVLPLLAADASTRFQLFFIGDPRGAQLEVSAPATTFG